MPFRSEGLTDPGTQGLWIENLDAAAGGMDGAVASEAGKGLGDVILTGTPIMPPRCD